VKPGTLVSAEGSTEVTATSTRVPVEVSSLRLLQVRIPSLLLLLLIIHTQEAGVIRLRKPLPDSILRMREH